MRQNVETVGCEQRCVLRGIETRVIERLALECADGLAMRRSAREHQRCAREGVRVEDREHRAVALVEVRDTLSGRVHRETVEDEARPSKPRPATPAPRHVLDFAPAT
jgi:hypothetical protein